MELKCITYIQGWVRFCLLIEPNGIEIVFSISTVKEINKLLIEPNGIEITYTCMLILLYTNF